MHSVNASSLQIWIVMVFWASTIHGIPNLPGPKAPHNAPPSTGSIDEPPRVTRWSTTGDHEFSPEAAVDRLTNFGSPEDYEFKRNGAETPVFTHDFAMNSAQKHQPAFRSSNTARVTPDKAYDFANGSYEHPSAVPPPLRRTSGDSSSSSLRERYMEKDQVGLGINLSEVGSFKDNDTTMGTPRVKAERERKDFAKSLRNMDQRINDLHTENIERLAYMSNRLECSSLQNTLAQVRQSVNATGAALIQFGMDDEKVQLIAEKVVDAPSHHQRT
ncbi:hypothetical protein D6D01_01400 [Aureobasidium pullulans]|uniref:BZIP domain-containing protein n=1 Tax=Aureobasidium pullulans TaxID=5580 RepID=A0A4S9LZ89_AURPU|nr:hypothetical protein D6D01_01400 [Aureobasidium pullulans]